MGENQRNLSRFPYPDHAIFKPSKIKLALGFQPADVHFHSTVYHIFIKGWSGRALSADKSLGGPWIPGLRTSLS